MKKLLCYLGILILFGLAILPPVLRLVLPDQVLDNNVENVERINLNCSNSSYITSTSYDGDEIKMIVIKHIKNEYSEDLLEDETKQSFIDLFEDLTTKNGVLYKELSDGEVVSIDYSVYNDGKLNLTELTKKLEDQKSYYESQGLSCLIKK